jgi:hypothetical protein
MTLTGSLTAALSGVPGGGGHRMHLMSHKAAKAKICVPEVPVVAP